MNRRFAKMIALLLTVMMAMTLFAGCGGNKTQENTTPGTTGQGTPAAKPGETAKNQGPEAITLPIVKSPLKLTLFSPLDGKSAVVVKGYGEQASFKEIEKRTGIQIEWQHPPAGQETEQFNLMMASQQMPDLVYYGWRGIPGGPEKAIQDGAIIKLNDVVSKYAPNLNKIFEQYPDAKKQAVTDSGTLYVFPMMRGIVFKKEDMHMNAYLSPQMRKDWLDKLGLQSPNTIDEWEKVLVAFKEKDPNGNGKADEIPFISSKDAGLRNLAPSWGILYDFYKDGEKIKYGPLEPAYKEYVTKLRDWYKKGLIDPDYLASDGKNFNAKVTGDIGGAYIGSGGGNFLFFTRSMKDKSANFKLTAVPWPKGPAGKSLTAQGDLNHIVGGSGLAISTKNKHVTESAKWADYAYSEEGITLLNWGIEGQSYKAEGGRRVFTDAILKDPNGLDVDSALLKYAVGGVSGWATVQAVDRYKYNITDVNTILQDYFKTSGSAGYDLIVPPITPTAEESSKMAAVMNEVTTYRDEMFNKFVMGLEPMENYDKFVQNLKNMGIEDAVKIQNAALERYNKRK